MQRFVIVEEGNHKKTAGKKKKQLYPRLQQLNSSDNTPPSLPAQFADHKSEIYSIQVDPVRSEG